MEINIGMTRSALRTLAADILSECEMHANDEGIEVQINAAYNGTGPDLTVRLSNDDMEGDHIPSPDSAYWSGANDR